MQSIFFARRAVVAAWFGLIAIVGASLAQAATWDAGGVNNQWSTVANWSDDASASGKAILFDDSADVAGPGPSNVVSSNITVASLAYTNTDALLGHFTQIDSGVLLTVNGAAGLTKSGAGQTTISGPGSLQVTTNLVDVTATVTGETTRLDMSGLNSFTKTGALTNFNVGLSSSLFYRGEVILANTNAITATTMNIGVATGSIGGNGSLLELGQSNDFNINSILVGVGRNGGTIQMRTGLTGTPTFDFTHSNGSSRGLITIGSNTVGSNQPVALMDLMGTDVNAFVSTLTIGAVSAVGRATGTLNYNLGDIDATSVVMGDAGNSNTAASSFTTTGTINLSGTGTLLAGSMVMGRNADATAGVNHGGDAVLNISGSAAVTVTGSIAMGEKSSTSTLNSTGAVNISGGTLNVGGNVTLGNKTAGATSGGTGAGTLNITGGAVTIGGNVSKVTANSTATLILDGGSLDMTAGTIGDTFALNTLTLASGTLSNVAQINGGAGWNKTTSGTLILAGTNSFTGTVNVNTGTLRINGTSAGANYNVISTGKMGGTGTVSSGSSTIAGRIAPGNSVGNLTMNNQQWQNGGSFELEVASALSALEIGVG